MSTAYYAAARLSRHLSRSNLRSLGECPHYIARFPVHSGGFPPIGCAAPLPSHWFIFSALHIAIAVKLHCFIKKKASVSEKKEFPLAS